MRASIANAINRHLDENNILDDIIYIPTFLESVHQALDRNIRMHDLDEIMISRGYKFILCRANSQEFRLIDRVLDMSYFVSHSLKYAKFYIKPGVLENLLEERGHKRLTQPIGTINRAADMYMDRYGGTLNDMSDSELLSITDISNPYLRSPSLLKELRKQIHIRMKNVSTL